MANPPPKRTQRASKCYHCGSGDEDDDLPPLEDCHLCNGNGYIDYTAYAEITMPEPVTYEAIVAGGFTEEELEKSVRAAAKRNGRDRSK